MKNSYLLVFITFGLATCIPAGPTGKEAFTPIRMSEEELKDKIRGGWAGQVIGCTFGGPTEFSHQGTMIRDYQSIPWDSSRVAWYFDQAPGLYDDVYMDLTFMKVLEDEGIGAPAESHARAFANASYPLWHANQAARYNILQGILPPESGFWKNNPHSDDIDFQIEADFAGLMTPGLPNAATELCDRVGHIMNYGDGWYGGVYIAAMYSLAFIYADIRPVVKEALAVIPEKSSFRKCIQDVIDIWEENPKDWKSAWFKVERDWASDVGCPDGVFRPFNIDAKVNAAYVVIGLLYGNGDLERTMEISTRCGQDSDCNPASAAGILATVTGYSNIPEKWLRALKPVEDRPFAYTGWSLNRVYETGFRHAWEVIRQHGGVRKDGVITWNPQEIAPVRYERGFEGLIPTERRRIGTVMQGETRITFSGSGFVLTGSVSGSEYESRDERAVSLLVRVDGLPADTVRLPLNFLKRRHELAWDLEMKEGPHTLVLSTLEQDPALAVRIGDLLVYRSE